MLSSLLLCIVVVVVVVVAAAAAPAGGWCCWRCLNAKVLLDHHVRIRILKLEAQSIYCRADKPLG